MGATTEIDVPGTQRVADRVESAAGIYSAALTALHAVLDQHDGCWSDDEMGKAFAKNYVDTAKQALDDAKTAADTGNTLASGLRTDATELSDQDANNAASITAAGSRSTTQDV
jgi:uncharacterized protein YukE